MALELLTHVDHSVADDLLRTRDRDSAVNLMC